MHEMWTSEVMNTVLPRARQAGHAQASVPAATRPEARPASVSRAILASSPMVVSDANVAGFRVPLVSTSPGTKCGFKKRI